MQGICRWVCEGKFLNLHFGDMAIPFQARSRYVDEPHAAKLMEVY